MFTDTLFQSALYVPLILGIFLSFKILRLTDLTADGSLVLGAGIYARLLTNGCPQSVCFCAGIMGGGLVGIVLAFLQKNNRIPALLASILCVFILQSINLLVMGRPNISLLGYHSFFNHLTENYPIFIYTLLGGLLILFIYLYIMILQSKIGLIARAFGINDHLLKRRGYPSEHIRKAGLALSNMLYALSGILCTQVQKFVDISMGMGVSLIGIGAVIMGGQFVAMAHKGKVPLFNPAREVLMCIVGIFNYFLLMRFFLASSIDPSFIKLLLGIILIFIFISHQGAIVYDRNNQR